MNKQELKDMVTKTVKTVKFYQNIETGEILTKEQMIEEGINEYDLGDETNIFSWSDYYKQYNPHNYDDYIKAFNL